MFTFHLAYPEYHNKEARALARVVQDLNESSREEEVAVDTVQAFFKSIHRSTCESFGPLVGAAFAVCRATPKHPGECECPTCSLHDALGFLVQMSVPFEREKSEIMNGWGNGWAGLGWPQVNPHVEKLKAEFVPKEFIRLAAEYDKAKEAREF